MKPSDIFTYKGLTARLDVLAKYQGLSYNLVKWRVNQYGLTPEEALSYRKGQVIKKSDPFVSQPDVVPDLKIRKKRPVEAVRVSSSALYYTWAEEN